MRRHAKLHGHLSKQGLCFKLVQDAQRGVGYLLIGP